MKLGTKRITVNGKKYKYVEWKVGSRIIAEIYDEKGEWIDETEKRCREEYIENGIHYVEKLTEKAMRKIVKDTIENIQRLG